MDGPFFSDLSHFGFLSIAGHDAKKFLQGQLTCNLEEITSTRSLLGAHCNPQGRVISLFNVFFYQDQYLLQMPRELIPVAEAAFKKYAVFFKVTLMDISDTTKSVAFNDPSLFHKIEAHSVFQHSHFPSYTVIGNVRQMTDLSKELSCLAKKVTPSEWTASLISHGIPNIYPETVEKFLPHELNLPALDAVSFNKGCYTGQEIIARMQYKGKLKNHLHKAMVSTNNTLQRGSEIYNNSKACGYLVDYGTVDSHLYAILFIVQDTEADSDLFIDVNKQTRITIS